MSLHKMRPRQLNIGDLLGQYAIVAVALALFVSLSLLSGSFLTSRNLLNIANQSAPLALIAAALTLVVIGGDFDLSSGAVFGLTGILSAWTAGHMGPAAAIIVGPLAGLLLGMVNGAVITGFNIHSFLATLATSMVFRGLAELITGGALIPVRMAGFAWLGRGRIGMVHVAAIVLAVASGVLMFLLNRTTFGRRVFAVGGNEQAAILSGIRTRRVKIAIFAIAGSAAGLAGVIGVSRISIGQPQAGAGLEFSALAAVILGGTSIYGGRGAIWRSLVGVFVLALIGNGFNILNINPFYKDLTTGLIIVAAVALGSGRDRRR
jgi:ribose transport system permease protein